MVKKTKLTEVEAKIAEIENKIPIISRLATDSPLTAIKSDLENKIYDVSSLVRKTDYNTKTTEIEKKLTDHNHDKHITTSESYKLTAEVFDARIAGANLLATTDFDTKLKSLNQKINSNKTKHMLVENELKKHKHLIQFI